MAPRDGDEVNPPAVADGQGPADWSDDEDDDEDDDDAEFVGRVRRNQEEIPEWIKVDNIEDFKRLCEIHCGNGDAEAALLEMRELRRQQQNPENPEA